MKWEKVELFVKTWKKFILRFYELFHSFAYRSFQLKTWQHNGSFMIYQRQHNMLSLHQQRFFKTLFEYYCFRWFESQVTYLVWIGLIKKLVGWIYIFVPYALSWNSLQLFRFISVRSNWHHRINIWKIYFSIYGVIRSHTELYFSHAQGYKLYCVYI